MTIQTNRLVLRPVEADDVAAVLAISAHPDVRPWLLPGQATEEKVQSWVEVSVAHWTPPSGLYFGFVLAWRESPTRVIGTGSLVTLDRLRRLGWVGWTVDPEHGGRGVATEAAGALLNLGFGACRMRRVRSECYRDNKPSRRVMEKVGMTERRSPAVRLALSWAYPDARPKVRYEIGHEVWWRRSAKRQPDEDAQLVGAQGR